MSASASFAIVSLSVNNVLWTPYVVKHNCNKIIFLNAGSDAIVMRTDDEDPSTALSLPAGSQYIVDAKYPPLAWQQTGNFAPYRFVAAALACYFQSLAVGNTGPILGTEIL